MPLYDFRCQDCGEEFEELLSITLRQQEIEELRCPSCESARVERMQSRFATLSAGGSGAAPSCGTGSFG